MEKKDAIISAGMFCLLILIAVFIGFKMGKMNGMDTMCETIGGKLGMNQETKDIVCVNSSFFDPLDNELDGYLNNNYGDFEYEP